MSPELRLFRQWAALGMTTGVCYICGRACLVIIGLLLVNDYPFVVDALIVAGMVAGTTVAAVVWARAQRTYFSIDAAPSQVASKGVGLIESARVNRRLAWLTTGCGIASYLAAVGGLTALIRWSRDRAWGSSGFAAPLIFALFFAVVLACYSWERKALRRIALRWQDANQPSTTDHLYDHELDHQLAADVRPAS